MVTELDTTIILRKVPKAVLSEFEDVITLRSGLVVYRRGSHIGLASPQTSFGVLLSRIHFSPTWGRNECVTNEP